MRTAKIGSAAAPRDVSRIVRALRAAVPPFDLLNVAVAGGDAFALLGDGETRDPAEYLRSNPGDPKVLFNVITAVTREYNLPRILHSMESSMAGIEGVAEVCWIVVFDAPGPSQPYTITVLQGAAKIRVNLGIYHGPKVRFGIHQKNLGFDLADDGAFCVVLDDDNVLHPRFLPRMTEIIRENPAKRAFVVGQKRWDMSSLRASVDMLVPCSVDNTMCLVNKSLIGSRRHDPTKAGLEDYHYIRGLYDATPEEFVFVDETLAYYNYLNVSKGVGAPD